MFSRKEQRFVSLEVLKNPRWPEEWPFTAASFRRQDESDDTQFYSVPRYVAHIDNFAISALRAYYDSLPIPDSVLDLSSSWISHYPPSWASARGGARRRVMLGMNQQELDANEMATERGVVRDLNKDPTLPFAAESFDLITNCVSVDYLTRPLEVFREMGRCLRPGGRAVVSFSNRCFPTKAIDIWLRTSDAEHCFIVGCYFHFAGGFDAPEALDIAPHSRGVTDPMYVVTATKSAGTS
jgi:SAM-dependent methyltransferase